MVDTVPNAQGPVPIDSQSLPASTVAYRGPVDGPDLPIRQHASDRGQVGRPKAWATSQRQPVCEHWSVLFSCAGFTNGGSLCHLSPRDTLSAPERRIVAAYSAGPAYRRLNNVALHAQEAGERDMHAVPGPGLSR
jgi:hypothetical protein